MSGERKLFAGVLTQEVRRVVLVEASNSEEATDLVHEGKFFFMEGTQTTFEKVEIQNEFGAIDWYKTFDHRIYWDEDFRIEKKTKV